MSTTLPVIIDEEIPVFLDQIQIGGISSGSVVTYTDLLDATLHVFNRHTPISMLNPTWSFTIFTQIKGPLMIPRRHVGAYNSVKYWSNFAYRLTLGRSQRPALRDPNMMVSYVPDDICAGRSITDDLPVMAPDISYLIPTIEKMVIVISYQVNH